MKLQLQVEITVHALTKRPLYLGDIEVMQMGRPIPIIEVCSS